MAGQGGMYCVLKNSKQETDQTVLTITKTLTKTTNCAFRDKKMERPDKKFFRRFAFGRVAPLHFQIRFGATECIL